jgi:hypothetical protein
VGSLGRRLEDLERNLFKEDGREPKSEAGPKVKAVVQEFARLKASCAPLSSEAGGVDVTRVPGENIPRQILGPGYTYRQLIRLAGERASEAGAFPEEEIEAVTATMLGLSDGRMDVDEVVRWEV